MKYFLHDTNAFHDEKVTELFIRFGYEGIGLFFTALERIAAQEKPVKTEVLKTQLHVGKKLEKAWKFMEEIGLLSTKNGETFNENLLKFSEKYQIKKEKTRERVAKFREQAPENEQDAESVTRYMPVTKRSCNAGKVKESKVKVNKEIDAAHECVSDFKSPEFLKAWADWKQMRFERYQKTYTAKEEARLLRQLYKDSGGIEETAHMAIASAANNGYEELPLGKGLMQLTLLTEAQKVEWAGFLAWFTSEQFENVSLIDRQLLPFEYFKLREEHYGKEHICSTLRSMENYNKITKYKSVYLTLSQWLKKDRDSGKVVPISFGEAPKRKMVM